MNILETMIKIGAVWTGAHAVAQAAGAAQKVEKSWLLADLSIKKVVQTLAAFGLGWKGVEAFSDFLKEGISNAREMRDAQEKLNMVLAGNKKFQEAAKKHHMDAAVAAKEQTEELTKLAEKLSETGLKAKTLETAWAGAIKAGFSPKQIEQNAVALENLVTKVGGIKAGTEEATHAMMTFRAAIQGGRGAMELAKIGVISYEDAKALKKMGGEAERSAFLMKKLAGMGDLTAKMFQTTAGQVERAHRNWEKLGETLGGPLVKSQDAFTIAMGKVAVALQPVADELAPKLTVVLNQLATAVSNSGPYIIQFGKYLAQAFEFVVAHWSEISRGLIAIGSAILVVKTALAGIRIVHDLVKGFTMLQTVMSNLPAVIGLLSNPITLTIAAIAALGFAIYWMIGHWDQVKAAATSAWNAIQAVWGQAATWFQNVFQGIATATKDIWGPLVEPLKHLFTELQPIVEGVIKMFTTAGDSSAKGFNPVRYVLQGVIYDFNVLTKWLHDVWTVCTTQVGPALMQGLQNWGQAIGWVNANVIGPIIDAVAGIIGKLRVGDLWGAFQVWMGAVGQIRDNIVNGIVQVFAPIVPQITGVVGDLWNAFSGWVGSIVGRINSEIITPIVNLFRDLPGKIGSALAGITGAIGSALAGAADALVAPFFTAHQKVNDEVVQPIVDSIGGIVGKLSVGDLWGAFQSWVNVVSQIETEVVQAIVRLFQALPAQIAAAVAGVAGAIMAPFKQAYDAITGWFSGLGAQIANAISGAQAKATAIGTSKGVEATVHQQHGGLVSNPTLTHLAEAGIPEMVIPIEGTGRSRGLLSQTASMLGMGRGTTTQSGPISISMNVPITISGVAMEQAGAVGREVQRAMQDPVRSLLDQLRRAKDEEARLAYA